MSCFVSSSRFRSILHARRHSSQQVCRHRITGQQLSEHPAADTGTSVCVCVCVLTVITGQETCRPCGCGPRYFIFPRALKPAAGFPPPLLSHRPTATLSACAFVRLYFTVRVHSPLYLAHMQPTLEAVGLLPCYLSQLLTNLVSHLSVILFLSAPPAPSFALCSLPRSPSWFLPSSAVRLAHMPPPLPPVLFSLVSNRTRLEPAQLCSSTHGNHLRVDPRPCFFALRSLTSFPPVSDPYCLWAH